MTIRVALSTAAQRSLEAKPARRGKPVEGFVHELIERTDVMEEPIDSPMAPIRLRFLDSVMTELGASNLMDAELEAERPFR